MKRAKKKTHRTSVKTSSLTFAVWGSNENANWSFNVDVEKKSIEEWPKIFRGLADLIESGELQKELARECEEFLTMNPLPKYFSPKAKRR